MIIYSSSLSNVPKKSTEVLFFWGVNFQLEEQLKELMEQKDTVQSQLDNFRKVASDGDINNHLARRWVLFSYALMCYLKKINNATVF